VIAGDLNRLSLKPILSISHDLVQTVKTPTRLNPPAILDPIITTMASFYADPVTKPPINPDLGKKGAPSDHLTVLMRPLTSEFDIKPRIYKSITVRPLTDSGLNQFRAWIETENWAKVYTTPGAEKKAEIFQDMLSTQFEKCFTAKTIKVSEDDQPWVTTRLKKNRQA